jgi:GDPmannose 4,6-dehydratase
MKKAFITGITGQDGSYLAELLVNKGYKVIGLVRRASTRSTERLSSLEGKITLVEGDVTDLSCLMSIMQKHQPDEVYNLAAQSFVKDSFSEPIHTTQVNAFGALNILEAVRLCCPDARVYQASTSEMYGKVKETPQKETTPFHPRSPYGVAKAYAHFLVQNYRESYGMFACCGILFNHESPRRGEEFVTKKITKAVAKIKKGKQRKLFLGNLDAKRDWGFAPDFVEAMWLMLQQDEAEDFVIATGETQTVREFCRLAFERVGLNYQDYVHVDPQFYRPAEVDLLLGDCAKAQDTLGWYPRHTFTDIVNIMVDADMEEQ